jgi:hypothetical protein
MININTITDKRNDLVGELEKVHNQLKELDTMKTRLTAQGNLITGAIQQCDVFLNMESESSPDETIPVEDDNES